MRVRVRVRVRANLHRHAALEPLLGLLEPAQPRESLAVTQQQLEQVGLLGPAAHRPLAQLERGVAMQPTNRPLREELLKVKRRVLEEERAAEKRMFAKVDLSSSGLTSKRDAFASQLEATLSLTLTLTLTRTLTRTRALSLSLTLSLTSRR